MFLSLSSTQDIHICYVFLDRSTCIVQRIKTGFFFLYCDFCMSTCALPHYKTQYMYLHLNARDRNLTMYIFSLFMEYLTVIDAPSICTSTNECAMMNHIIFIVTRIGINHMKGLDAKTVIRH